MKPTRQGYYWVYDSQEEEWVIAEYDESWMFVGSDVTLQELDPSIYHIGCEVIKPTYKVLICQRNKQDEIS